MKGTDGYIVRPLFFVTKKFSSVNVAIICQWECPITITGMEIQL